MRTYKYTDATNTVVHIIDEDGKSRESCLADVVPDGDEILPADTPSAAEIVAGLTAAVQAHLDKVAKSRGYDGILSACTYATDTHPPFKMEGQACVNWRGEVWSKCYQIMAAVQAGTHQMPTAESLIAELPVMVWPA